MDRRRRGGRASRCCDRPRRARERAPRRPAHTARVARPGQESRPHLLRRPVRVLVDPARRSTGRKPRRRLAARRSDDRHLGHPRWVQRRREPSRRLEVPILTSLGLGVALLGIVLLAAGSPPAGSTPHLGRAVALRRRPGHRARRLPPAPGRPRRQDRLGTRAQLAARRSRGGASTRLCAPLRCAVARRAARRLALDRRARARRWDEDSRASCSPSGSSRSPSRSPSSGARSPGSGCSPTPASSTWA